MEEHFSKEWSIKYQKSDEYLATISGKRVFNIQHDIFLSSKYSNKKIIIDTKYKLRPIEFKTDIKKGVLQNDLYQMTSYAFRRGCAEILLLYPNLTEKINEPDVFEITSGFDISDKVRVTAMEIPFWTERDIDTKRLEEKLYRVLASQLLEGMGT